MLKPAAVEHVYVIHERNIALRIHEFLYYGENRANLKILITIEFRDYMRILRHHRAEKEIAFLIYTDFFNSKVNLILFAISFFMTFLRIDARKIKRRIASFIKAIRTR